MSKYMVRIAFFVASIVATFSWQQPASACGGGGNAAFGGGASEGDIIGLLVLIEAPPIVFGVADLGMASRQREPSAGYGVAEALFSAPALIVNSALAASILGDESADGGAKLLAVGFAAIPALTFVHGVKWAVKGKRRRPVRPEAIYMGPPGLHPTTANPAAALATSSGPSPLQLQLAAMPVSDGKSIGAGVGVLGRF